MKNKPSLNSVSSKGFAILSGMTGRLQIRKILEPHAVKTTCSQSDYCSANVTQACFHVLCLFLVSCHRSMCSLTNYKNFFFLCRKLIRSRKCPHRRQQHCGLRSATPHNTTSQFHSCTFPQMVVCETRTISFSRYTNSFCLEVVTNK